MKPLRRSDVTNDVPLGGRGHRTGVTLDAINQRDRLLRQAADRFCAGMTDRAAAAMLHTKIARYRSGAWRRDAAELLCPVRYRGTITELLWCLLKVRDAVPSERLIRMVLSRSE